MNKMVVFGVAVFGLSSKAATGALRENCQVQMVKQLFGACRNLRISLGRFVLYPEYIGSALPHIGSQLGNDPPECLNLEKSRRPTPADYQGICW